MYKRRKTAKASPPSGLWLASAFRQLEASALLSLSSFDSDTNTSREVKIPRMEVEQPVIDGDIIYTEGKL